MSEKRDEKVSGWDTGRSCGTNPRGRKPMCFEPGVWNQPVGYSVLAERTCPSQDERAQTCKNNVSTDTNRLLFLKQMK